jgi:hypothetical protein
MYTIGKFVNFKVYVYADEKSCPKITENRGQRKMWRWAVGVRNRTRERSAESLGPFPYQNRFECSIILDQVGA